MDETIIRDYVSIISKIYLMSIIPTIYHEGTVNTISTITINISTYYMLYFISYIRHYYIKYHCNHLLICPFLYDYSFVDIIFMNPSISLDKMFHFIIMFEI